MKNLYKWIVVGLLFCCRVSCAQSFSVLHDSVIIAAGFSDTGVSDPVIISSGTETIKWKVIATNFPADWPFAICDNAACYTNPTLWPSGAVEACPYSTAIGAYNVYFYLSGATTSGCFYLKVRMDNAAIPTDTAIETFIVCDIPTRVLPVPAKDEVAIYPNPAISELNVVYDPGMEVCGIVVCDIIGKPRANFKVNNHSANLDIRNIPAGIYFIKLLNSHGGVAGIRKFTKQ